MELMVRGSKLEPVSMSLPPPMSMPGATRLPVTPSRYRPSQPEGGMAVLLRTMSQVWNSNCCAEWSKRPVASLGTPTPFRIATLPWL